jgi:hypothetical protein
MRSQWRADVAKGRRGRQAHIDNVSAMQDVKSLMSVVMMPRRACGAITRIALPDGGKTTNFSALSANRPKLPASAGAAHCGFINIVINNLNSGFCSDTGFLSNARHVGSRSSVPGHELQQALQRKRHASYQVLACVLPLTFRLLARGSCSVRRSPLCAHTCLPRRTRSGLAAPPSPPVQNIWRMD